MCQVSFNLQYNQHNGTDQFLTPCILQSLKKKHPTNKTSYKLGQGVSLAKPITS